ncbi:MAG: exonuclease SbcCD subunit D [Clostridiales bacterium]|nr:exonuclease SbcCD subunit D [Clostridiales bacterium]
MKLLHLADLHLGKTLMEAPLLEEQAAILDSLLDYTGSYEVNAILLAGDLYDRSVPPAEAVELFDRFLSALAERGIPVLAAAGNHDSPERLSFGSRLFTKSGVHIAGRYHPALTRVRLSDGHGPVDFTLLPFLRPVEVRAALNAAPSLFPQGEIPAVVHTQEAVKTALSLCPPEPGVRQVLLAHQFVCAGGRPPETCDSETPCVGGVEAVDVSCFDGYHYVALGHIHRPQKVGWDTVRYAGSPLKYSLSEVQHHKSFPVVTLGAGGVEDIELVPFRPLHDLRRIRGGLNDLLLAGRDQEDAEDFLWAVLTGERVADPAERLRAVYPRLLHVEYERTRRENGPDEEEETDALPAKSPLQLFEEFYAAAADHPLTDRQREILRETAAGLQRRQD